MNISVTKRNGTQQPFIIDRIHSHCEFACDDLEGVSQSELELDSHIQFYDGIPTSYIEKLLIVTAADKISPQSYNWTYAAARLLLLTLYKEVTGGPVEYPSLRSYLEKGVEADLLDEKVLTHVDVDELSNYIQQDRDLDFTYIGLQTLANRYFLRDPSSKELLELPQHFFMRVAIGLTFAENKEDATEWAKCFYDVLSKKEYMTSTPTLFNSGTRRPQLSSCFLLSMDDSTRGIFSTLEESAHYSKYSGGIGMDFSPIRARGSLVNSTKGRAGGIIPYMKLLNETMGGFDQGGKRLGSAAAYLPDWHADVYPFLEIQEPAKDHRHTAHDIFPALWISDLFMNRVEKDENWSLFDPKDVPELNTLYGEEFEKAYLEAEEKGLAKEVVPAMDMFVKYITKRFETGKYFPGFKDNVNRRNTMKDAGIVRSSNLCTEIVLRTRPSEYSAVCNLGSVNLSRVNTEEDLARVIPIAVRMLDNVIEIGLIPHENGRKFNEEERAVGLGVMGYAEWLAMRGIPFQSQQHLEESNELFKLFSYYAYNASADLAQERGSFPAFEQSEWAKGVLPYESAPYEARKLIEGHPGYSSERDQQLRAKVRQGMRNSNVIAIAPTATIANICGTLPCIEEPLLASYEKENLNGKFEVVAPTLQYVNEEELETNRNIDQSWIVKSAAVRQIWIDQSQSVNLFLPLGEEANGRVIAGWHTLAWRLGLKTLYYLRGVSKEENENSQTQPAVQSEPEPRVCSIEDPSCESCQ